MADGPIFLNTPITLKTQDAVGVDLFVDKVNSAIDEGAQMIAIASPFGAGKSSVVEVLQHTRTKRKWWRRWERKDKFVEVSMWSHLSNQGSDRDTIELHKNFIYQMASQIKSRKGTYISRRLSQNYGLLRLHANKGINWLLTTMALLLFAIQWFLTNYSETAISWIPWLKDKTGWIAAGMMFSAIILGIVVLTTTDIVFSSNKSEGARTIDGDEIMDLYRAELLKPRRIKCRLWKLLRHGTRYIVIIEDLDRTDAPETVLAFLKELRKYYVPEKDVAATYVNQVNFIVTIKPEELLVAEAGDENTETSQGSLYAKIFDYTLTLRKINIANYDAILHELLSAHKEELKSINAFEGYALDEEENLAALPGMEWIIWGEDIGVREIKERLNIAFTLFETLKNRSSDVDITFEKCAAAAYLTTAFAEDFYKTSDSAFQELFDHYSSLHQREDKEFSDVAEVFNKHLPGTSEEYRRAVWDLIRSEKIDASYRLYYYNYPRGSVFYRADERLVHSAIVLGEHLDGLEEAAQAISAAHSKVAREAYQKIKQLGMPLPAFVFEIEPLYLEAVRYNFEELLKRMAGFDYSTEGMRTTLVRIERILGFDAARAFYTKIQAESFCELWEKKMSESALRQLRLMLCKKYPHEILWYRRLFKGTHGIISSEEMEAIPLCYVLELVDQNNGDFSKKEIDHIVHRYATKLSQHERDKLRDKTREFLWKAKAILQGDEIVLAFVEFMQANGEIEEDSENFVCQYIEQAREAERNALAEEDTEDDDEDQDVEEESEQEKLKKISVSSDTVYERYQQLINALASSGLSNSTLEQIRRLKHYEGFADGVTVQLEKCNYMYEYALVALCQGKEVPYDEEPIQQAICDNAATLYGDDRDLFLRLRTDVLESNPKLIDKYAALFGERYPMITEREIKAIEGEPQDVDLKVINLTPADKVTVGVAEYFSKFFCRCKHQNGTAARILCFIGGMKSDVAEKLFYSLDFDAIPYRRFAKDKQKEVKASLTEVLKLDIPKNQIRFMEAVRCLDGDWEKDLTKAMETDSNLEEAYVRAVNKCEKVSPETISTLMSLKTIYPAAPHVTDTLLREKKYVQYVVRKTLWEGKFVMDESEMGETLWKYYVEIFGTRQYKNTCEYMAANDVFLYKLMEKKEYTKLKDNESMLSLARLRQDEDSITEVFGRGDDFALTYLLRIDGFQDRNAASKFVELVDESPVLLASDELYQHIHGKLIDGPLKAKYTNRRKR